MRCETMREKQKQQERKIAKQLKTKQKKTKQNLQILPVKFLLAIFAWQN